MERESVVRSPTQLLTPILLLPARRGNRQVLLCLHGGKKLPLGNSLPVPVLPPTRQRSVPGSIAVSPLLDRCENTVFLSLSCRGSSEGVCDSQVTLFSTLTWCLDSSQVGSQASTSSYCPALDEAALAREGLYAWACSQSAISRHIVQP